MTGSIGSRPIAGSSLGDGVELDDEDASRDPRRIRPRLRANRYSDIGMEEDPVPTPETPTYDSLSPDKRSTVNRMIIVARVKTMESAL